MSIWTTMEPRFFLLDFQRKKWIRTKLISNYKKCKQNWKQITKSFWKMGSEEQQSIHSHHDRRQLCTNRPKYRASKRLTAVKVCQRMFVNYANSIKLLSENICCWFYPGVHRCQWVQIFASVWRTKNKFTEWSETGIPEVRYCW